MCWREAETRMGLSKNQLLREGRIPMTNQTWRTRSCLVPLPVLAMCVALAGCNRDRGPGVPAMTHVVPGNSPCANCWCAQCGPCSGFHPTVWQSWQEGSMALRGRECENGTAPVQHGLNAENGPALPAPSRPHPEWIPTPEANKSDESTTPGMAAPRGATRSRPRQRRAADRKSQVKTRGRLRPARRLRQPQRNCPPSQ